jgi:hypothetical protein
MSLDEAVQTTIAERWLGIPAAAFRLALMQPLA